MLLSAVFLPGKDLLGQSVLDETLAAAVPPPSTSFFPLSQVHRGLHGTAYTVFEGTQPEAMEVEILGVLHNAIGPHQDMILARLHGPKPEYSGVVAGMSGSPVYIDGKLVGALAYRIGEFSKEPIAGITPIGEMLEVRDESHDAELSAGKRGLGIRDQGTELRAQSSASSAQDLNTADVRPIETPLVFSGFGPEALALWREHVPGLGLTPVAGIGGSSSGEAQPEPIIPGSAVSAVLVRGDLEISATCTVTYVDPKQLLACGHPITQFGPVSMPMTKAEVVATLPSPYNAFKIINTTETVGSFTEDRETAIRGQFGKPARMIPLTMHLAQDGAQEKPRTLHLEVIDQEQITPAAVMVSLFQSLIQTNGYTAETTYRVRGTVKLTGYPVVKFENLIAPTDFAPANLVAALALGEHFNRLYANAARRTPIESVDVDVDAIPGRRTVQIESAQAGKTTVHAGDTILIETTVRPWRGEMKNIRIPVTLPATLPDGPVRLLVSDGGTLDRLMQPSQPGGSVLDVNATIAQLNNLHANDRLYVTLLAPDAQAAIDGRTLTALPLSMANVLEPVRDNRGMTLSGESAVPLGSVALDAVLSGQQVVTLRVE
ncbi:MAG TPA: SpoIVB peptidase S55 domain-containing protein [Silvibacterium sp.]|nr:SpoIVB peptidase S55 domain-containing protein [Silvibacterium sp.]